MINIMRIEEIASQRKNDVAITDQSRSVEWHQFHSDTNIKIYYLLHRYGKKLPSQVCYISKNRYELITWLAAFSSLSIPVTGMDYSLPAATLKLMIDKINASLILVGTVSIRDKNIYSDLRMNLPKWQALIDLDSAEMQFKSEIPNQINEFEIPANKSLTTISFTSGTSTIPKPVVRHQSFDKRRFEYFTNKYKFVEADQFMVAMPLYHAAGNGWARLFLSIGASIHLVDNENTSQMLNVIAKQGITATVLSPWLLSEIVNNTNSNHFSSTLRWVLVGGKNFSPAEKKSALDTLGNVVYEYYGTTESGVNTIAEPYDLTEFPCSVGRTYDGNTVAIISANGEVQAPEQIGNVCIASYMLMDDYLDGGGDFFTSSNGERYFITSDIGYLDLNGRLYLLNREGSKGFNSPLYTLENALKSLPNIIDIALITTKSGLQCVFVPAQNTCDSESLERNIKTVAENLNIKVASTCPVEKIPYSPSGKVRFSDLELSICNI